MTTNLFYSYPTAIATSSPPCLAKNAFLATLRCHCTITPSLPAVYRHSPLNSITLIGCACHYSYIVITAFIFSNFNIIRVPLSSPTAIKSYWFSARLQNCLFIDFSTITLSYLTCRIEVPAAAISDYVFLWYSILVIRFSSFIE